MIKLRICKGGHKDEIRYSIMSSFPSIVAKAFLNHVLIYFISYENNSLGKQTDLKLLITPYPKTTTVSIAFLISSNFDIYLNLYFSFLYSTRIYFALLPHFCVMFCCLD